MYVVKSVGYDPRAFDDQIAKATPTAVYSNQYPKAVVAPSVERQIARARWMWEEDVHNLPKHNPKDVDGNFVAYAGSVQWELDQKYDAWVSSGKAAAKAAFEIDLNDRIGSTGTEQACAPHYALHATLASPPRPYPTVPSVALTCPPLPSPAPSSSSLLTPLYLPCTSPVPPI
jgi:hypothetical protein